MPRAIELLRNNFGVSQLYQHEVVKDGVTVLTIYWHPLTIAERESIQKKPGTDDANEFALALMIQKALDKEEKRLFADGDKDKEWRFLFSLAKELGKTVSELTATLTREEMVGWAAFFALQNEEMEKDRDATQSRAASRTQSR
mgnify:CR=1 FL=1